MPRSIVCAFFPAQQGDYEQAAALIALTLTLWFPDALEDQPSPFIRRLIDTLKAKLGEDGFKVAWERGEPMDVDEEFEKEFGEFLSDSVDDCDLAQTPGARQHDGARWLSINLHLAVIHRVIFQIQSLADVLAGRLGVGTPPHDLHLLILAPPFRISDAAVRRYA